MKTSDLSVEPARRDYRLAWNMTLPVPLLLALRYLRSTRRETTLSTPLLFVIVLFTSLVGLLLVGIWSFFREAYVSFLSILATAGIAIGVSALILVLAGLAGLQNFLRKDVMARTPHIEIAWPDDADAGALAAELRAVPGVLEARHILRGRGWLLSGDRPLDVEVVGYEGDLPSFFPSPTASEPGLYIDHVTAQRWVLGEGDLVDVVSPRPTLTPFGPQPRVLKQRIAGVFRSGRTEDQDHRIALPLPAARRLLGERQTRLEVRAESFEAALDLVPRLEPLLPAGSRLQTWKDLNRGLFFALRLERMLMFVSVFLIVPVAAMSLVTVLGLLISSKRAEIGMLQAMGARPGEIRRAFLVLGSALGFFGLFLGSALGLGGAWLLDRYRLIAPPGDVYFIDHIPFLVQGSDFAATVGATVFLVLVSTIYAANRAASMRAVEALRL